MRIATLIFRDVNTDKKNFKNLLILNVLTSEHSWERKDVPRLSHVLLISSSLPVWRFCCLFFEIKNFVKQEFILLKCKQNKKSGRVDIYLVEALYNTVSPHTYISFLFSPLLITSINLIGCHRGI